MTDTKDCNIDVGSQDSSGSAAVSIAGNTYEKQIGTGVAASTKVAIDREEYLLSHRDLQFERRQLQMKNNILHRRLADYYRKRKLEHVLKPLDREGDLEEKYGQKLLSYEDLKLKEERELTDISNKLEVVEVQYQDRLNNAEIVFNTLQHLERSTGIGLIYSNKGKPIADKTVNRFLNLQRNKSDQCSALRLRFIRARNAVSELDCIIRKLEKLGPGLYVAKYEQMQIEHQNYMNKIEEREDELIKNRGKCTEHNQILAHIREKMHHTDELIDFTECDLGESEMEYLRAREDLGSIKNRRDKLRWSLEAERNKAGLLTRKDLLRDFQNSIDEVEKIKKEKEDLSQQIIKNAAKLREARHKMQEQNNLDITNDD